MIITNVRQDMQPAVQEALQPLDSTFHSVAGKCLNILLTVHVYFKILGMRKCKNINVLGCIEADVCK